MKFLLLVPLIISIGITPAFADHPSWEEYKDDKGRTCVQTNGVAMPDCLKDWNLLRDYAHAEKWKADTCQTLFDGKSDYCPQNMDKKTSFYVYTNNSPFTYGTIEYGDQFQIKWKCSDSLGNTCLEFKQIMVEYDKPSEKPKKPLFSNPADIARYLNQKILTESIKNQIENSVSGTSSGYDGESLKNLDNIPTYDQKQYSIEQEKSPINKFPDVKPPEKQFIEQKPKPKLSFWDSFVCWFTKC